MSAASSVVIRGIDATTFSEMESFVKNLETRPLERLLRDLPELAKLSATKFSLVSYVVAGKYKACEPVDRPRMRDWVVAALEHLEAGETRDRVQQILDRMR